jgi:hypothetical protein
VWKQLHGAKVLSTCLDNSNTLPFQLKLKHADTFFPSTAKKYQRFGRKTLVELKTTQKEQLQHTLWSETQPIIEKANVQAEQPKTIFGKALPVDLNACRQSLMDMQADKERQMQALAEEIEEIKAACGVVELMQTNHSLALDLQSRAKKQKT